MDKKTNARLNRIIGQCNGVKNMIEGNRDCVEILQQIIAIRSGLSGLGKEIIKIKTVECVNKKDMQTLEDLLDLITKL